MIEKRTHAVPNNIRHSVGFVLQFLLLCHCEAVYGRGNLLVVFDATADMWKCAQRLLWRLDCFMKKEYDIQKNEEVCR